MVTTCIRGKGYLKEVKEKYLKQLDMNAVGSYLLYYLLRLILLVRIINMP